MDEEIPMNRAERRAKFKKDLSREEREDWIRATGRKTRKSAASLKPKKRDDS